MSCKWVSDNFGAFIDGDLVDDQATEIRNHLSECEVCSSSYDKMVRGWDALNVWEDSVPPVQLRQSILNAIREERFFRLRIIFPLASAAILIIGISLIFLNGQIVEKREAQTEMTAVQPSMQIAKELQEFNEEDIISNLQILQEQEFYDSLEALKKIDYLPLVEEVQEKRDHNIRSALERLWV